MADIKKFLDQAGVSTLWSKIAEELEAKQSAINAVDEKVGTNADKISTLEGKVEALEKGTYDDTEVRDLISTNADAIADNTEAIGVLNGDAETAGSVANTATGIVATKIAEVVAGADAKFDTLKEIADWILNDTTGAANMANKIAALEGLVGNTAVATQISNAIDAALKVEGVDKYALASDLTTLAGRVKALEDAGHVTQDAINAGVQEAKDYADSLAANYDAAGTAQTKADAALVSAKAYTDTEVAKIQALTEAEILEAINEASGEVTV